MRLSLARLLVIICCFVCSDGELINNPELEWDNMSKMTRKVSSGPLLKVFRSGIPTQSSNSEFRMLPDFVVVSSATDQKALFVPERGTRPLPNSVKSLLFPTAIVAPTESTQPKVVEILCHIDRIYVRIRRDVFKTLDAYNYLKLGTCPVNHGTSSHYYFLYLLTSDCGFTKESNVDNLIIQNVIHYMPTTAVLRDLPFDVPVQCSYQRFHHSYKVGVRPKLLSGTLFKSLRRKRPVQLVLQDEFGNEMTRPFVMGEPMFFEAKPLDGVPTAADERMYINKCFITPSLVPSSANYTIIDNYGCMVDGKEFAESRFLVGLSMRTQRFTINAVILKEVASSLGTKKLYMHCDVSVGRHPPTQGLKACNYDAGTQTWKEIYGYDSVCSCCDSSCSPAQQLRAFRKTVTSQPLKVDLEEDDKKMKTLEMTKDEHNQWDHY